MQHASTNLQLTATGALMDPDFLRASVDPRSGADQLAEIINKAALSACAAAFFGIAVAILARVG
jgi:hypothetical protein